MKQTKTKTLTYGDLRRFLEAEGFTFKIVEDAETLNRSHSEFFHPKSGATLLYPRFKASDVAADFHIGMARHILAGFGIVEEADFDKWVADPKHFQAA